MQPGDTLSCLREQTRMKQDIQAGCKDQQCQGKTSNRARKAPVLPAASQGSPSTGLPQQMPILKYHSWWTQDKVFLTKSR